jgi:hypothetical protein
MDGSGQSSDAIFENELSRGSLTTRREQILDREFRNL